MSGPLDFAAWRLTFQSDAQAARVAFDALCKLNAELARAKSELLEIAKANRGNFEDSAEYRDWAASRAAATLATLTPAAPRPSVITRSPALCLYCKQPLGKAHADDCYFIPFVSGKTA